MSQPFNQEPSKPELSILRPFHEAAITPNSPWRNCSCFVICDKACGNGKMIRGAD